MTRRLVRVLSSGLTLALLPIAGAAAQAGPLGTSIPKKPLGKAVEVQGGPQAFLDNQLTFERVVGARKSSDERLRKVFEESGVPYPASEIFLRVFKHERVLELWARGDTASHFTLIKEYPVCALPGQLGPKQKMGDLQVPEGFYFIDRFNPRSSYHLSLRVNYPNLADRMRRQALWLGGDIFIHGGCETVGCVPIENQNIEEVYWLAVQAMDAGQRIIPVHIFPARLDPDRLRWLEGTFHPEPDLLAFWQNLAEGYAYFEQTHQVPWVTVGPDGRYAVPDRSRVAGGATAEASATAHALPLAVQGPADAPTDDSPATDSLAADSSTADSPALPGRPDPVGVDSLPAQPAPDPAPRFRLLHPWFRDDQHR